MVDRTDQTPRSKATNEHMTKPTAISLFAGAGGMDAGFHQAGFDVKLAIEIDPSCCETLRHNMKSTRVVHGDINALSSEEICELSGLKAGFIDCVFGGPPCQSFSLAGRREGLNDERGLLVFRFIEIVRELRPKTFVLENVKGMVNWQGGIVLREIEKMLAEPLPTGESYEVKHSVLNAADFGVPQNRERVFIVGSRTGKEYRFPLATHSAKSMEQRLSLKPHVTVGEALGGLPKADAPSETALRVSRTIKGRIDKHGY
ncbi:MAG: DNA cytosine methyltransferase [Pseudomonadota bacterium]